MSSVAPAQAAYDWKSLIESLLNGAHLEPAAARWAMDEILGGNATPAQTAGFLVALRAKGETIEEVAGFVEGMLGHAELVDVSGPLVDTCGTGGDGAHTVNISSMAAVTAAAAGARVVKHGNRAASSQSGSADVFEALGVKVGLTPAEAAASLNELGITFLFAPSFHPAMRHVGPVRREMGVRTVFNMIGPLANPASPGAQVVGVPNEAVGEILSGVLAARGTRALVVLGHGGTDELTADGPAQVWDATSGDGSIVRTTIDPQTLGIEKPAADSLRGGTPADNAEAFLSLLDGDRSGRMAAVRDAVALNAAAALVAFRSLEGTVGGTLEGRIAEALPEAYAAIDSGAAKSLLERWVAFSNA